VTLHLRKLYVTLEDRRKVEATERVRKRTRASCEDRIIGNRGFGRAHAHLVEHPRPHLVEHPHAHLVEHPRAHERPDARLALAAPPGFPVSLSIYLVPYFTSFRLKESPGPLLLCNQFHGCFHTSVHTAERLNTKCHDYPKVSIPVAVKQYQIHGEMRCLRSFGYCALIFVMWITA